MTEREAAIELKRRGWIRKATQHYVPPSKRRGIPRTGLSFDEACSFEAISYTGVRKRQAATQSSGYPKEEQR